MIKKIVFVILSVVLFVLALFVPLVIAGNGFELDDHFFMILILLWLLFLMVVNGFALFLSDEGFGKITFFVYIGFGGALLIDSLLMLIFFKADNYPLWILKYTAVPIALYMIIVRYIDVGYGRDGWVSNLLINTFLIAGTYLLGWLFIKVASLMVANIILYSVALALAIFAVVKSITRGRLADTDWGVGPRGNYSSSSSGSSGPDFRRVERDITPAEDYEIENLLEGLSARDFRGCIEYEIKRVEAHSDDGGYNFDVTIYVKVDTVYGANFNGITNKWELERSNKSAADNLKRAVLRRLNDRGVGYNLQAEDY